MENKKEHVAKEQQVVQLKEEKANLEDALEKQTFTPMEVQEMAHKKALLEEVGKPCRIYQELQFSKIFR